MRDHGISQRPIARQAICETNLPRGGILKEYQAGLGAKELCRKHGISDATFYKWRSKYGGMEVSDARRLKALEAENTKLKS